MSGQIVDCPFCQVKKQLYYPGLSGTSVACPYCNGERRVYIRPASQVEKVEWRDGRNPLSFKGKDDAH